MSQKTGKRSRRLTTDDDNASQFKLPPTKNAKEIKDENNHENGANNQQIEETTNNEINGNNETIITTTTVEVEKTERVTRSRSSTPQIKHMINGKEETDKQSSLSLQQQDEIIIEETVVNTVEKSNDDKEMCEMDPLVLDEPDPELVFDENSDYDNGSGKSSPILNRCTTRRSQTRNIPTPKTPPQQSQQRDQLEEEEDEDEEVDEEKESSSQLPPPSSSVGGCGDGGGGGDDLSSTFETCDNLSTKAEIGSDLTRFDYLINNRTTTTTTTPEPSSFLLESKDRSFTETLKHLSSRRPINDYRRRMFNKIDKNDLNSSAPLYPSRRESVERVSVGNKRKIDDIDNPYSLKRFKLDTSGLWMKLTSPLTNIKSTLKRSDIKTSTPKLTGYKDQKLFVEDDGGNGRKEEQTIDVNEKRWCIIM